MDDSIPRKNCSLPPYPGDVVIPNGVPTKCCTRCEKVFPRSEIYFHRSGGTKSNADGLFSQCKWCKQKDRSKRPPAPIHDPTKKQCARCRQWFPKTEDYWPLRRSRAKDGGEPRPFSHCKTCHNAIRTEFYHRHKDEKGNEWKEKHREWKVANPEQARAVYRAWYHAHPEQIKAIYHRRRARKAGAEGTLTDAEIAEKLRLQHFRCYYCHAKFERIKEKGEWKYKYHVEHTIPLSRIEYHPRHDRDYVVLACQFCNDSKHDKLPHEWPQGGRLF